MNSIVKINDHDISVKEYYNQRVITFKDIDTVHERAEGTARKRFNDNRKHFIEGTDFFVINQASEIRTLGIERPQGGVPEKITLITESGYLMLVKSFTDDLAWEVQRQLVNSYFKYKEESQESSLSVENAFRLAELINSTPPDKLPIIRAVFLQAGVHIPETDTHTDNTRTDHDTGRKTPVHNSTDNHVNDFLKGVNVINRPTSDVYKEYVEYCSEQGTSPISNIVFSKMVNRILGSKIIQKKLNGLNKKIFVRQKGDSDRH